MRTNYTKEDRELVRGGNTAQLIILDGQSTDGLSLLVFFGTKIWVKNQKRRSDYLSLQISFSLVPVFTRSKK